MHDSTHTYLLIILDDLRQLLERHVHQGKQVIFFSLNDKKNKKNARAYNSFNALFRHHHTDEQRKTEAETL